MVVLKKVPDTFSVPASPDPFIGSKLKNSNSTGGSFTWTVNPSLPTGQYFLYACLSNAINTDICLASQEIKIPITIKSSSVATPYNDKQRLTDVAVLASALELYFNDRNMYPDTLSLLVPGYLSSVPVAPTPPDGTCSQTQNTYNYTKISNSDYSLGFCFGGNTQSYTAGPHTLSPAGIR